MLSESSIKFASNVVKGRIAETLVEEMFKNSGYKVYRFGYEAILQNISQSHIKLQDSETKEKIRSIPDFIVVSPKGSIQLIEVKYSSSGKLNRSELQKYLDFWSESRIIIVTPNEPHFRISYIAQFMKDEKTWKLEKDRYTKIDPEIIKTFSEIVKIYFRE